MVLVVLAVSLASLALVFSVVSLEKVVRRKGVGLGDRRQGRSKNGMGRGDGEGKGKDLNARRRAFSSQTKISMTTTN